MGRPKHSKRSHSSSSSSSSSDTQKKKYKKSLKQKNKRIDALEGLIKDLRRSNNYGGERTSSNQMTSESNNAVSEMRPLVRYVGRNDFIPVFNPQQSSVSVEHWIRNLESTGKMHGWDERTLICNCTAKLSGYAKSWYEQQASYDISWSEWKEKLIKAFPFSKNKLSQIRELVNRVKLPTEDPIEFYYKKLGLGMSCQLNDEVIAEAIIGTLGNDLIEIGAKSAGCRDTGSLLQYLAGINSSNINLNRGLNVKEKIKDGDLPKRKCFSCGQLGHRAKFCRFNKDKENRRCSYCSKPGHVEAVCFSKKRANKHCSSCNMDGHTLDECRKQSKTGFQNKSVRKIQTVCCDSSDKKYFKEVLVNGTSANAFLDFGSSCNTMTQGFYEKQGLELKPNEDVVIKGYGNALITPVGAVTATLTVDGAEQINQFFIVPDNVQNVDILVGQTFTESPNLVVVKTPTELNIYENEMALQVTELCDTLEKTRLYPQADTKLAPGINKILARMDPIVNGAINIKQSEQRKPLREKDILEDQVETTDGCVMVKLVNRTNTVIDLKGDECIARAELLNPDFDITFEGKIGQDLDEGERARLNELLTKYDHCFSGEGMELGDCSVEMSIKLTEDKIINYKPYRLSFHERDIVRKIIEDLLRAGIIESSRSPFASPVVLVKKKDGGHRLCVDYRALNKITEKERYPLPVIQDLLDRLVDQSVFCCLDLANGYHQVRISEDSRPLTGFVTPDGHYQYKMMSFGLCNAPAVFQRAMNEILGPVIHVCAEVYIDDVIIWGRDSSECLLNLEKVLDLIERAGVKLRKSKCAFLTNSVEYLGHEISGGTIRPSAHKITAVSNFKVPSNIHELRQFLGLASYFRKFIRGFATIARPLTLLTKKSSDWHWGAEQERAVQILKSVLTSDPVLTIYHPERETQVHTDASKLGLGAVLLQKQPDGETRVVAYASRQTAATEERYHSFELEALAVVFAVQRFRVYLSGIKFRIVTDCSALRMAWQKRDLSPRIARWWLDLQEYDFDVDHRPGSTMAHVDALSRNPVLVQHVEEKDLIDALQESDEGIQTLIQNLKLEQEASKGKKSGLTKDYKVMGGKLFRLVNNGYKPVLPKGAKFHILRTYHDENGHPGAGRCLEAIQSKYWFPKMRKCVEKYVASCIGCQFTKKPTGKQPGLLHPIPRTAVPFHTLHVDHLGPFCKSNGKTYIFAVVDGFTKFVWLEAVASANARGAIAALTKFNQVFGYPERIISDRGTAFTGKEFQNYCKDHGIKHILNAVASPRANGQVERLNRTILSSLSAHVGEDQKGWDAYLPKVQLGINSLTTQGTGKSPLELLCGLRPRLANDLQGAVRIDDIVALRDAAAQRIEDGAVKMKTRFDKRRREGTPISVGQLVMVERKILRPGLTSGKLVPKYAGPYKVTAVLPNDRYEVTSSANGRKTYKNIIARDKLKLWHDRLWSSSSGEE